MSKTTSKLEFTDITHFRKTSLRPEFVPPGKPVKITSFTLETGDESRDVSTALLRRGDKTRERETAEVTAEEADRQ